MDRTEQKKIPSDKDPPREIEFTVIDADFDCGKVLGPKSTGTLIDLDIVGIGLLTRIPLQPGNLVQFDHRGITKTGIVMWSVESSDNFRIQVRFL